ncbi:MAG: FIST C-terminal domain-containing protein [Actinobacteria bacterium]|nr:FIST C-terminal domain-containing protein [Actinomycetota bacterium]
MRVTEFLLEVEASDLAGVPTELDGPATLVLLFAGGSETQVAELPPGLVAAFGQSIVVGCSTSGCIEADRLSDDVVVGAVAQFEHSTLKSAVAELARPEDSYDCGGSLARQLSTGSGLRAVIVLAPGLGVNGSALVQGLTDNLPPEVLVTGGLAGDGTRFGHTWVLHGSAMESEQVVAVGLYGSRLRLGHGSRGGWEPFGPERVITASNGNVLNELDGRPALELYRQYLGDLATDLPASGLRFPLAVRESRDASRALTRTLLAVDEDAMTMTFAGDVPQGWLAQLMGADSPDLLDGASDAALQARPGIDRPVLAIAVSCVGRRMVLGEGADEELERTFDELPAGSVQAGFYSYGELSPTGSGVCELHNQTMTLTTITED